MGWFNRKKSDTDGGEAPTGQARNIWRLAIGVVVVLIVFCLAIMMLNYRFPKFFPVEEIREKPGTAYTRTLIKIAEDMSSKWLVNDKVWPTVFLDNPRNFQLGLLEGVRYNTRVLRDKLSRLRTTDKIDHDCEAAFVYFSNDPFKWILPSAESKFDSGVKSLKSYEKRLAAGQAQFYQRADNLNELLDQYVSLLGGVNTRLANAPRRKQMVTSEETSGDQYTKGETSVQLAIPWREVDDNFYYAQGVAYTLRQMMLTIKYEFKNIMDLKNAGEMVDRIIDVLDQSQFEPLVILNGDFGSIFANHSVQLQSLLEDARQKMRSLQDMIRQ
ncbi:MAG: DUF2333 family protein [Pseudomonadota bacterium]